MHSTAEFICLLASQGFLTFFDLGLRIYRTIFPSVASQSLDMVLAVVLDNVLVIDERPATGTYLLLLLSFNDPL
jgi:hypothetical protein